MTERRLEYLYAIIVGQELHVGPRLGTAGTAGLAASKARLIPWPAARLSPKLQCWSPEEVGGESDGNGPRRGRICSIIGRRERSGDVTRGEESCPTSSWSGANLSPNVLPYLHRRVTYYSEGRFRIRRVGEKRVTGDRRSATLTTETGRPSTLRGARSKTKKTYRYATS